MLRRTVGIWRVVVLCGVVWLLLTGRPARAQQDSPPGPPPPHANLFDPSAPPAYAVPGEKTVMMARGGLEVCNTLTMPLRLIPVAGTLAALLAAMVCVYPSAMTADYMEREHGWRHGTLWQGVLAGATSRAIAELAQTPLMLGTGLGVAAVLLLTGVGTGFFRPQSTVGTVLFPLLAGGILLVVGMSYGLMRNAARNASDAVWEITYDAFAPPFVNEEHRRIVQTQATVRPPLNGAQRLWLLASFGAGVEAPKDLLYAIPVFGPLLMGYRKVNVMKDMIRRLAREDLHEEGVDFKAVDLTIGTLAMAQAGFTAGSQMLLMLAGGALLVGSGAALVVASGRNLEAARTTALVSGLLGAAGAGAAIMLMMAQEVVKMSEPVLIPLAYGLWPKHGWFTSHVDGAATDAAVK